MNHLFPNFEFASWLTDFYITSIFLSSPNIENEDIVLEKEKLMEMIEHFDFQIHSHYDEENPCLACSFIKMLNDFNEFVALLSLKETNNSSVVEFFLRKNFPSNTNHKAITKALMYRIKGYNAVDKNGKDIIFTPYIVKNIKLLLNKYNISFND